MTPTKATWSQRMLAASVAPFVPLSFGHAGFAVRSRLFADPLLALDLAGQTHVVTGATSGIGEATARGLLQRGADVVALVRPGAKADAFAARARDLTPMAPATAPGRLHLEPCDLADLDQSVAAARRVAARHPRLHGLALNAGLLAGTRTLTAQGHETSFAVHVVVASRLIAELRPALAAAAGRVVFVSSGGMLLQPVDPTDLGWLERPWDGTRAYAQAKRVQVELAQRWATLLDASGVRVDAMHPGWAATPGVDRSLPTFASVLGRALRSPEEGADTLLWLLATQEPRGPSGGFFFDRERVQSDALPWTRSDGTTRARIWHQVAAWAGHDDGGWVAGQRA